MKIMETTFCVGRSTAFTLLMNTFCLAKLITEKQHFINTKDIKIIPSSSTLKKETAPSPIACSTLCCMLESCCSASYDKKTRQCVLEESCFPQSDISGDALIMKKSTDSSQCQNEWFQNENKCYYFSDDKRNWNDSKSTCESYCSMLVEVITSSEMDFLKRKATSSYWLGGTDIENEGDWMWSTSQTDITFADWGDKQPNNSDGNEHCLQMKYEYSLTWNDDPCTYEKRFICEKGRFNLYM